MRGLAAAVLVALAGLTVVPPPAEAQTTTTYVSNIGQEHATIRRYTNRYLRYAQGFTTGNMGDDNGEYALESVQIDVYDLSPTDDVSAYIYSADTSGNPDSIVHSLENPSPFASSGLSIFTAPENATLSEETDYFLAIHVSPAEDPNTYTNFGFSLTNSHDEDSSSESDWSIHNEHWSYDGEQSIWVASTDILGSHPTRSFRMAIRGSAPADTTAPTVSSATVDGTSLVITFSENLAAAPNLANSAFVVEKSPSGGSEETVALSTTDAPAISNNTVTLTLATAVVATDTGVKVTYTVPTSGTDNTLKDAADNEVATFTDQEVTNNTNSAPTVQTEIPNQAATAGTVFTYTFPATTFADADSDDLTYTAVEQGQTGLPTWLEFNATTRTFSGTPMASDVETLTVEVTASDGTDSVTDSFDIVVSATGTCAAPTGRRTIWTGTVTVGEIGIGSFVFGYGYIYKGGPSLDDGALDPTDFTIGGNTYTIDRLEVGADSGTDGDLFFGLTSSSLTAAEVAALRVHVCDTGYDFSDTTHDSGFHTYRWHRDLDWSSEASVTLHLSLPENNDATGKPTVTGTAEVGEELTAATGTIADADGLPSSFDYQWIRVDGANETDITGETSSTYTLTAADLGKKVKVRVSFTDLLGGEEQRTSDAYPASGTVAAADANNAPRVDNTIPDQTATAGTAFSYAFPANTFADADNDDLTYTAVEQGQTGLPTWLNFTAGTRTFSGTPQSADVETLTVEVTADDGNGGTVSDEFDIVVSAAPVLGSALISNIGQVDGNTATLNNVEQAQTFGTGGNAAGYTVTSVEVEFASVAGAVAFSAGIWSSDEEVAASDDTDTVDEPHTSLGALTCPALTVGTNTIYECTTPGIDLAADTVYLLVLGSSSSIDINIRRTTSNSEDAGGALGWTIGNRIVFRIAIAGSTSEWQATTNPLKIRVKGTAKSAGTNTAATGKPAITGTATVGQELTAATGTIADADGLPSTFSYQWIREDADGMNPEDITGQTASTYTLTTDDEGKKVKVRVSFTDVLGSEEQRTSDAYPETDTVALPPLDLDGATVSNFHQPGARRAALQSGVVQRTGGRIALQAVGKVAQTFTTGPEAGGYTLDGVDVRVHDDRSFDVELCAVQTAGPRQGRPTGACSARFTRPTLFGPGRRLTFTPSETITLDPATTYAVVLRNYARLTLDTTDSDAEDRGSARGWTIGNGYRLGLRNGTWAASCKQAAFRLAVRATAMSSSQEAGAPPAIEGAPAVSDAGPAGRWTPGDPVDVTLTFTEAVTVDATAGTPTLALRLGGSSARRAGYHRGSGTPELVFRYTLTDDDGSHPSMFVPSDSLALNGGTIRSTETHADAELAHVAAAVQGVAVPALTVADATVAEAPGATLDFVVTLSPASALVVTVDYATTAGSATAGADYTTTAGTLTFAANETTNTIAVPVIDDADEDSGETLTLTLTNPVNAQIADGVATGTITNDESGSLTARFAQVPPRHDGVTAFTVEVHLSQPAWTNWRTVSQVLEITGGRVTGARRLTPTGPARNRAWGVTVTPSHRGDVTLTLPARACTAPHAVCANGQPLAQAVDATVPGQPFTGAFTRAPAAHDGTTAFEVVFALSEPPGGLSWTTVRDRLFDVTGGTLTGATRTGPVRNQQWTLTVVPAGTAAVTLVARTTTSCTAAHAVCTADGRPLDGGATTTIAGPVTLAVADAEVEEAAGATLDFVVTLSRARPEPTTVAYATANGSATAGADYEETAGTLTFAAGDTARTVAVPVLDDVHDEGTETLTLTLTTPSPATVQLTAASATGTIRNSDPLQTAWLARFGRTVGTHVTDAITERLRGPSGPDSYVTIGGYRLPLGQQSQDATPPGRPERSATSLSRRSERTEETPVPLRVRRHAPEVEGGAKSKGQGEGDQPASPEPSPMTTVLTEVARVLGMGPGASAAAPESPWLNGPGPDPRLGRSRTLDVAQTFNLRQVLLGSSFRLGLGAGDAASALPRLTAWGRFAGTTFNGRDGDLSLDGDVFTGTVGVDGAWDRLLAGVAVAHSRGDGAFRMPGTDERGQGELEQTLTSLHPYLRYAVTDRLDVWGVVGYGWGEVELALADGQTVETDTTLVMGAFGGRGIVLAPEDSGGYQLATRTDALLTRTSADAAVNTVATDADAHRLRVILEGSRALPLAAGRSFTPTVELGVRHDWGDAETGFGLEVGGRVQYADPRLGLTVDAQVRGLVAHEDTDYQEWGASGTLRLAPATGHGLSLTLAPTWGAAASGVEGLWSRQTTQGLAPQGTPRAQAGRLAADVGYGFPAPIGTGLLTPYVGTVLADGADRTYRVGTRLQVTGAGFRSLTVNLEGTRQEPAGTQPVTQGLRLDLTWGF